MAGMENAGFIHEMLEFLMIKDGIIIEVSIGTNYFCFINKADVRPR
jgi:hypothetical protein